MLSDTTFEALVRPGKKWKTGTHIHIGDLHIECTEHTHTGRVFVVHTGSIYNTLDTHGELPLPPYIEYSAEKEKDYQTVFAHTPGSVAAPTASLHFTQELLDALPHTQRFVTLHVGLGTFRGIDTTDVRDYDIHSETIDIPDTIFVDIYTDRQNDKKICAIGTTVARTLESLPYLWGILSDEDKGMYTQDIRTYWDAIYQRAYMDNEPDTQGKKYIHTYVHTSGRYICDTTIYITPGYVWYVVDDLITNFHLPKSSLLVLVASLLGYTQTMRMYQQAIADGYRFYSFGDGMYIQGG
jgi:S-adenosylmethionine:tRNA ribosyltransferase-isomerase